MPSGVSIAIRDLKKKLGPNQALNGATTEFEAGWLHGLIGPDGAGKTTLLRSLMGLLRPDAGEIVFRDDGKAVSFSAVRPYMAYMPQQQSLYADLSIGEHLDFFRDLYRLPRDTYDQRRRELLAITRLDKFTDRPAGKLSGGMYKKLGLMCALLASPRMLFLDEPTNGVDPISRREFWDMLYRLREQRILIVVATAYMDEAERCDRVHVLDAGVVLAHGEPRAVMAAEGVSTFEELFWKRTP
jgi:ABC-2 type transport system ATP-binding protein